MHFKVHRSGKSVWIKVSIFIFPFKDKSGLSDIRVNLFLSHHARNTILAVRVGKVPLKSLQKLFNWLIGCRLKKWEMHLESVLIFLHKLSRLLDEHL